MYLNEIKIIKAELIEDFIIKFTFANNKIGFVNFKIFPKRIGILNKLDDRNIFNHFEITDGLITWDNQNIDIAPETIYHVATGEKYPEWIQISNEEELFEKDAMILQNAR